MIGQSIKVDGAVQAKSYDILIKNLFIKWDLGQGVIFNLQNIIISYLPDRTDVKIKWEKIK